MIRLIVSILIIYILYKIIKSIGKIKSGKGENLQFERKSARGEDLVEDPVCHTYLPVSQAYKREIDGKVFYFCSEKCADKYILEKNN